MSLTLAGKTVAILVANGFDEHQMTEIQRALIKAKAQSSTVAPEQGVVNGWQGEGWGHYFPVTVNISSALGSDFDMLVLPGGTRGIARLKTSPHTRRIINHFLEAKKPIAAIGAGVGLLALASPLQERIITASDEAKDELAEAGATLVNESLVTDGNVLTANGSDLAAWVEAALAFFAQMEAVPEAA